MKYKIGLFLGSKPNWGGTFQYNQTILNALFALPKTQYDIVIIYTYKEWMDYLAKDNCNRIFISNFFYQKVISDAFNFLDISVNKCRVLSPYFLDVSKIMVNQKCDLWIFPSQDLFSYQIPVPALVSILDLMHRYEPQFPEVSSIGRYRIREQRYKNICKWAKGVLVESNTGKQQVMESYGLDSKKIHVLPLIAPEYMLTDHSANDFDKRYNLPQKFIFYPAQFWEHKNHKRLIQAIGKLKEELLDIKLVLVGSKKNGYESALQMIHSLSLERDVLILGYVPSSDIVGLYRRARALIMPTFFGPSNIPPLEAFAVGCPVGISNVNGIPDNIGNAALYFDPKSVQEISEVIKLLWIDDKQCLELSQRGTLMNARWGQKEFNKRFAEVIKDTCGD